MSEPRHEVKMVCEERAWPQVRSALRLLSAALAPLHPPRTVQSIYLDTHEGQALQDNLAGVSQRRKLRFRFYGEEAATALGTLEWKRRDNLLGDKDLLRLPEPVAVRGSTRSAFVAALHRLATPLWRQRLLGREPVQWIAYRREYWSTPDRAVRVTFDRGLRACDLRGSWRLDDRWATPLPRLLVVECKAPARRRRDLERFLQEVPLVVDKCSKFVLASAPGQGPLPARWDRAI